MSPLTQGLNYRSACDVYSDHGSTKRPRNYEQGYELHSTLQGRPKMLRLMTGFEDKWHAVAGESFKLRRLTRLTAYVFAGVV